MDKPLLFSDAVILARSLHRALLFPIKPQIVRYESEYIYDQDNMLVPGGKKILRCSYIDPVATFAKRIISQRKIKIKFFKSNIAKNIPGVSYKTGPRSVDIITPACATFCERRFANLKELIHQSDDRYLSMDTSARTLMHAIGAAMKSLDPDSLDLPLHIENFCFFCALEILLPWGRKGSLRKTIRDYRSRKLEDMVIAKAFRVPLTVIQYLSQCNYLDLSEGVNTILDNHES